MTASPVLARLFVAADLSVKAVYSDNSLFLLAHDGSTFCSVDPQGKCVTQLTLYAINRYKSRLAEVVTFRNLHVVPVLTIPSLQSSSHIFGYSITSVRWSLSPAAAEADGLLRLEADGSIALDSEDTAARVVLHANQSRIAVCYPLLLSCSDSSKHKYIWQTQLFAVNETPLLWQYPLHILQQASAANTQEPQQPGDVHPVLCDQVFLDRITELPAAVSPDITLSTFPKQSWWLDCSHLLPHDICILLEWTPDALYQYIQKANEAAVWIHADESCLLSEGGGNFLRHCKGVDEATRLYAAEAVPVHITAGGKTRYSLTQFAEHALALRQLGTSTSVAVCGRGIQVLPETNSVPNDDSSHIQLAQEIHEEHAVADYGRFIAYRDGSVHVAFQDRTLLYLKSSHTHCDIITPDGHRVMVATATPVGVEQYVAQAMEFAEWVFSSPAQRASVLQQAAAIQKELGKCQRAALMCDWAQGHVPVIAHSTDVQKCCENYSDGLHNGCLLADMPSPLACQSRQCPSSSEREHVIQALLAQSTHLLSTLT